MPEADEFPLAIGDYRVTCYYQQGFFDGSRWKRSAEGDKHIAVCGCGRAVVAESLQEAVDKLHDSFVILPTRRHSHSQDTVPIPEFEILRRHPGLIIRYGRSSEDRTWWAEAREEDGRFIAATSGRRLRQALRFLGTQCDRREIVGTPSGALGLRENPLVPEELRVARYGLTQDLEAEEAELEEEE